MGSVEAPGRVGEETWAEFCGRVDAALAGYVRTGRARACAAAGGA